jgi:hypothetical protein
MIRILMYAFTLLAAIFLSACSQKPTDVLKEIQKHQAEGNYNNLNVYYTKGTVKAMVDLNKLYQKNNTGKTGEDKRFVEGARWDVVAEKVNGNDADLVIKYTEHPVQNMIGLELSFKLKKEDDKWKLDLEKDVLKSLEMIKNSGQTNKAGKTDYLNKMRQSLKIGAEKDD